MAVPIAMPRRSRGPLLIALLALLGVFAVLLLNGAPLFYRDTLGYLDRGTDLLRMLMPDDWLVQAPAVAPTSAPAVGDDASVAAGAGEGPSVNASRSMLFALLLSIFYNAHLLLLFPVIGTLAALAALWLPMRVAVRRIEDAPPLGLLVGLPMLAATAGSLPFYVAYLMADIFAPVLILICATLFAFAPDMRRGEILLAAAIGLVAVLVHPSHLLIAAALIPVLLVGAVLVRRRGWWIAPLVVAALVLCGAGERLLFRSAVETATDFEVTYFPFLTARVIADGPGLGYLDRNCPDAAIPACALHAALSQSDNPMRLTASHIVFQTSTELGSFRLMSHEDQRRVVEDEVNFALAVVLSDPLGVASSLLRNTLVQARLNSVEMTIPEPEDVVGAGKLFPEAGLDRGRLVADQSWLPAVETMHNLVYLLSLAIVALLLVWPHRVAWQIRLFALAILAGILANAFVCGSVSQPANRYGARVIWLLPLLATTMTLFAWPGRFRTGNGR